MNEMWAIVKIDIIRGIVSLKHCDRDINTSDSVSRSLGHFSSNHSGWRKNRSTNLFSNYIIRSFHIMNGIGWIFPTLTWVQRCVPFSKFYFHLTFNLEKSVISWVSNWNRFFSQSSLVHSSVSKRLWQFSFFVQVKCVMLDSVRLVSYTVFLFFFFLVLFKGSAR